MAARSKRPGLGHLALVAAVLVIAALQLVPFYIALTTALKPITDLSSPWSLPLDRFYTGNFALALDEGGILDAIWHTAIVTTIATAAVCVIGLFAAYPLARRPSGPNRLVFAGILAMLMVPPLSILVPLYSMLAQLSLLNTYTGEILVMTALNLPISVVLFTAFIRQLPTALEEAARIDGAGQFQIIVRVLFPLLRPVSATVATLTAVGIWNEYALSGYLLTDPDKRTVAPAIASFFSIQSSNLPAAAAAALIAVIPVVLLSVWLQRYFVAGMAGMGK